MSNDNPDVFPVITNFFSSHISNMLYSSSVVIFHYKLPSLLFYVQHIFFLAIHLKRLFTFQFVLHKFFFQRICWQRATKLIYYSVLSQSVLVGLSVTPVLLLSNLQTNNELFEVNQLYSTNWQVSQFCEFNFAVNNCKSYIYIYVFFLNLELSS